MIGLIHDIFNIADRYGLKILNYPFQLKALLGKILFTHYRLRLFWVRSKVESKNIKCELIRQQQVEAAWGTSGHVARI